MKKIVLILCCVCSLQAYSQDFITTWKTDNPGTSNNTSITIPTTGTGYSYQVDWENDGTHNYGVAGIYTIRIRGTFPRIYFFLSGENEKILSVDQWGNGSWTSMKKAFHGCFNLTSAAIDAPDLSNVTSMIGMFQNCSIFNQDISAWDVSNVTNMKNMLSGSALDCINYDATLMGWAALNAPARTLGVTGLEYDLSQAARNQLIASGWIITNDIYNPGCSAPPVPLPVFITTWKTDNPGTTNNTSITIRTKGLGYNYQVDWNNDGDLLDAGEATVNTSSITHDFGVAGTYTIRIVGAFPKMYFYTGGDRKKILSNP